MKQGRPPITTPSPRQAAIVAALRAGSAPKQAASDFGVTKAAVYKTIARWAPDLKLKRLPNGSRWWTESRRETLRMLWKQGHTASRIAQMMTAASRDVIIGKAHRMGLAKRPSPIHRKAAAE